LPINRFHSSFSQVEYHPNQRSVRTPTSTQPTGMSITTQQGCQQSLSLNGVSVKQDTVGVQPPRYRITRYRSDASSSESPVDTRPTIAVVTVGDRASHCQFGYRPCRRRSKLWSITTRPAAQMSVGEAVSASELVRCCGDAVAVRRCCWCGVRSRRSVRAGAVLLLSVPPPSSMGIGPLVVDAAVHTVDHTGLSVIIDGAAGHTVAELDTHSVLRSRHPHLSTLTEPDRRRRHRWNGCFPRGRQPHCRYLRSLIGRCRHRQESVCYWPAAVGSSTRQCCHRYLN